MTTDKRPEDMTVAETIDAIFGEGAAEVAFPAPKDLEVARQPYERCRSPFEATTETRAEAIEHCRRIEAESGEQLIAD